MTVIGGGSGQRLEEALSVVGVIGGAEKNNFLEWWGVLSQQLKSLLRDFLYFAENFYFSIPKDLKSLSRMYSLLQLRPYSLDKD